jgi:hypothetical protein
VILIGFLGGFLLGVIAGWNWRAQVSREIAVLRQSEWRACGRRAR